jgi:isopenicillin N synthase-like dioxygenase
LPERETDERWNRVGPPTITPEVVASMLPVIDLSHREAVPALLRDACLAHGFFYIVGHRLDEALGERLEGLSRQFFARDVAHKMRWRMALGGRAWRGYFPTGGELTSGRPDWKEGLYFGSELPADHPQVCSGTPLHGANLWPDVPGLREAVLEYMAALTRLGHRVMEGLALSLGLDADYFAQHYTADPLILFRIFNYPSLSRDAPGVRAVHAGAGRHGAAALTRPAPPEVQWGVGEHTDYGLLTLLRQDDIGGLEVKTREGWVAAQPLANSFVCNIGDMLDRMTGGLYRSTPHRVVVNRSGRDRLSFPLFFDPNFDARVQPLPGVASASDDSTTRWDQANVHAFDGTYGDYLLAKVSKVFPGLRRVVL